MSTPLVVRVGPPGSYATVWIQDGAGYVLEGGKWQPLTEAPGLGGWVLSASKVAEVVAEYGSPVAAPEPTLCCVAGCREETMGVSVRRCRTHFREFIDRAWEDQRELETILEGA